MIKSIHMAVLPHRQLRSYPDCGDWLVNEDNSPLVLCSADTGNDLSNLAILLHEFVEAVWCWQNNVTEAEVTRFDKEWFTENHNVDI